MNASDVQLLGMSNAQKALAENHGTPAEFAVACLKAVPWDLSMTEAADAIDKYILEWRAAKEDSQ